MPTETEPLPPLPTLVLVRDLIFASKISATAKAIGCAVTMLRDPAMLAGRPGRRLVVDLNLDGAITAAGAWRAASGGEVVGFVAHTDAATIAAARAAGVDRVLPRSKFVEIIADVLNPSHIKET